MQRTAAQNTQARHDRDAIKLGMRERARFDLQLTHAGQTMVVSPLRFISGQYFDAVHNGQIIQLRSSNCTNVHLVKKQRDVI